MDNLSAQSISHLSGAINTWLQNNSNANPSESESIKDYFQRFVTTKINIEKVDWVAVCIPENNKVNPLVKNGWQKVVDRIITNLNKTDSPIAGIVAPALNEKLTEFHTLDNEKCK